MAALVSVISAISGICSIIKFGESQFASQDVDNSKIKLQVGLDYDGGLSNSGGSLPDVRLFNEAGDSIGITVDPGDVDDGSQGEISIDQDDGQQATYALFSANDDAICVAYTSITWPDKNHYGWTGDWGKQCGGSWYYSHVYINNKNYKPACLWIDANGDQPQTGFSLHWPEFVSKTGKVPKGKDPSYFCDNAPVFKLHEEEDPNEIDFWVLGGGGNDTRLAARSTPALSSQKVKKLPMASAKFTRNEELIKKNKRAGANKHHNKLVISDDTENHATSDLCESSTSVGPDFLNTAEGLFCRMSDHTLYEVCNQQITDNCYNTDTHNLIVNGKAARDTPYEMIQDWTQSDPKE